MGKKKAKQAKKSPANNAVVKARIKLIRQAFKKGRAINKAMAALNKGTSGTLELTKLGKKYGFSFEYARAHQMFFLAYESELDKDLDKLLAQCRDNGFAPGVTLVFKLTKISNKASRKKAQRLLIKHRWPIRRLSEHIRAGGLTQRAKKTQSQGRSAGRLPLALRDVGTLIAELRSQSAYWQRVLEIIERDDAAMRVNSGHGVETKELVSRSELGDEFVQDLTRLCNALRAFELWQES